MIAYYNLIQFVNETMDDFPELDNPIIVEQVAVYLFKLMGEHLKLSEAEQAEKGNPIVDGVRILHVDEVAVEQYVIAYEADARIIEQNNKNNNSVF